MPTALMNMVEIEPISIEQTVLFCKWFRMVMCIREFDDDELSLWKESLKGFGNIMIANITPLEAYDKFRKEEFIDCLFFNNDIHADYINLVYEKGFVSGKGKQNIIKGKLKTVKGYWLARKV